MPRMRGAYLIAAFCNEFGFNPASVRKLVITADVEKVVEAVVTLQPETVPMEHVVQITMKDDEPYEVRTVHEDTTSAKYSSQFYSNPQKADYDC